MAASSDANEMDILECLVCHKTCDLTFFCFLKHAVCSYCKDEKDEGCSVCGLKLAFTQINGSNVMNKLALEEVKLSADAQEGEPVEIHCPFTVCKESSNPNVTSEKFISHLTNDHRVTSAPQGESVFTREMCVGKGNIFRFKRDGPKSPFLLHCYNFQFIQHSFCANGNFWFWVSILGSKKDADKFQTELTISHPSIKNRKMSWTGNVNMVNSTEKDVHNSGQCLVLQKAILDDYMDMENNKMLWKLKIEIGLKDEMQDADSEEPQDNWSVPKENSPPKSQIKRHNKAKRRAANSKH